MYKLVILLFLGVAIASSFAICRFCGRQSGAETAVLDGVCSDRECSELSRVACQKILSCGHYCGGIADEVDCLPCLHGCSGAQLRQVKIKIVYLKHFGHQFFDVV
jgi:hypothetical protein